MEFEEFPPTTTEIALTRTALAVNRAQKPVERDDLPRNREDTTPNSRAKKAAKLELLGGLLKVGPAIGIKPEPFHSKQERYKAISI